MLFHHLLDNTCWTNSSNFSGWLRCVSKWILLIILLYLPLQTILKTHTNPSASSKNSLQKPILIYSWVNGSDPRHESLLKPYKNSTSIESRYETFDEFRYSLRSVYKNFPSIDSIKVLVSSLDGKPQQPNWYIDSPSSPIQFIPHNDFFHDSTPPTFNSFAIESQLSHLLSLKLSPHVIYLNDDMFFLQQISTSDFFHLHQPSNQLIPIFRLEPSLYIRSWENLPLNDRHQFIASSRGHKTNGDAFGEWPALHKANSALDDIFSSRARAYISHVPRSIDLRDLAEAIQHPSIASSISMVANSPLRGSFTDSHQPQDFSTYLLSTHYRMEMHRKTTISAILHSVDWNQDGQLDKSERHTLLNLFNQNFYGHNLETHLGWKAIYNQWDRQDSFASFFDNLGYLGSIRGEFVIYPADSPPQQVTETGRTTILFDSDKGYPFPVVPNWLEPLQVIPKQCVFSLTQCLPSHDQAQDHVSHFIESDSSYPIDSLLQFYTSPRSAPTWCGDCMVNTIGKKGIRSFVKSKTSSRLHQNLKMDSLLDQLDRYSYKLGQSQNYFISLGQPWTTFANLNSLLQTMAPEQSFDDDVVWNHMTGTTTFSINQVGPVSLMCLNDGIKHVHASNPLIKKRMAQDTSLLIRWFFSTLLPDVPPWEDQPPLEDYAEKVFTVIKQRKEAQRLGKLFH